MPRPLNLDALTPREFDVVWLIAQALRNREIAQQLGTSPYTVRNQVRTAFRKLGICSRTELAVRLAKRPEEAARV